jgi:BCD family chlorophyll transporter-like MFS transporter
MNPRSHWLGSAWARLGPKWLPFADAALLEVPFARLLRLSLFQLSVGMALSLLVGTLNRVMIVELAVPASAVALMVGLPLLLAPLRVLVGYRSDTHRCALGWRRSPFIWRGTLLQWGGFAIMPLALLVLAGKGHAADAPAWIGQSTAALAFLMVGAGINIVQTAGLALATDLAPPSARARVVGLMYLMLLLGMCASALAFGALLREFSPGRLVQVIQGAAVFTLLLNSIAIWKQEPRSRAPRAPAADPGFVDAWRRFAVGADTARRLKLVAFGTMGFCMADVLLEPFGGQVLGMAVDATTRLSALLAAGSVAGLAYASWSLHRGGDAYRIARLGLWVGLPGLLAVCVSASSAWLGPFLLGHLLIGFGVALFSHGTLTATMNRSPRAEAGLALGAWGTVQGTAAGIGIALSGVLRDLVNGVAGAGPFGPLSSDPGPALGYLVVFACEMLLLGVALWVGAGLLETRASRPDGAPGSTSRPAPG